MGLLTMTATWVGGGYLNGTAEAVFDPARGLLWAQAPWGYAASLVLGGLCFARTMRRRGYTTLLDPFQERYGSRVTAVLFVPALVGEIFWSAAILTALGTTFGTILGLGFATSIVISAAISVGYTMLGGLRAVAYTDVVQLLCITFGLAIALPFALEHAGGLAQVLEDYDESFGAQARLWPSASQFGSGGYGFVWVDYAFMLVLGGIPWQVYFQRVLACPTERSAVWMSLGAAVGCLLMAIPAILLGAAGATADWASLGFEAPDNPALILPVVLQRLTPELVATLGLAAVSAAVMSSVDSSILSASSMFVWNVVRPLRPGLVEAGNGRALLRGTILIVGIAATILALQVHSVYALWYLCADFVYVILFPQLAVALWSRRATSAGALAGVAVALFLRLGGGEPLLGIPAFLSYPMQAEDGTQLFPFRTLAMLAGFVTLVGVSRLTARRDDSEG